MSSVIEEVLGRMRARSVAADDELSNDDYAEKITDAAGEAWDTPMSKTPQAFRANMLEIAELAMAAVQWCDRNYGTSAQ